MTRKEQRAKWRAAGKCTLCGRERWKEHMLCRKHVLYFREWNRKPEQKRKARLRKQTPHYKARARAYARRPEVRARLLEYSQAYRERHRRDPAYRARLREYRHSPKMRAYHNAYKRTAKYRAYEREYERAQRKRWREKKRCWLCGRKRWRGKVFCREHALYHRAWDRAKNHKRRASIRGSRGSWTPAQFEALCARYRHRCLCCGKRRKLTADHVIPVAKWPKGKPGLNAIRNIQPLCKPCNSSKNCHRSTDYRKSPHPNCLKR